MCFGAFCLLGVRSFAGQGRNTTEKTDALAGNLGGAPALRATMAEPLLPLLERTGRMVELFWEQVPSFTCTEFVTQEKLGKKGKTEYQSDSIYDYLALTRAAQEALVIEELRLPRKIDADKPDKPALLSTNGFSTLLLIFHPLYRANYRFNVEPGGTGEKTVRVRFEHIPGERSTSALMIRDRIYPLDLQGTAWVDPGSGEVSKISARLRVPMKDINVEDFRIDVVYKPQSFPSEPEARTLPARAVIEVHTALQHWRNTHSYSQYKRFSVESAERISK